MPWIAPIKTNCHRSNLEAPLSDSFVTRQHITAVTSQKNLYVILRHFYLIPTYIFLEHSVGHNVSQAIPVKK